MAKFSPDDVVSSVFKKFEGQWITPEFIRDESNRLSDAMSDQRPGDPGRTTRSFADKGIVQKDNPAKASAYCFDPNQVEDDSFLNYAYLYEHPDFNQELYDALNYVDSLRENMVKNPLTLNQAKRIIGGLNSGNENLSKPSFTPSQIIYYGVPGCGKSNTIKEKLKNVPDFNKVRVVFHPEYTNADFVGQILPVVKNGVSYEFTAGPFTRILAKAYAHPGQNFYLVIEEINRGNAAAIFGDVFQLLDRMKSGESDEVGGNVYGAGWSKYFVDNEDVNTKICEVISSAEYVEGEERPTINFTENTAIRLPPNLSILATMNTSDQNVFTLDNAFQRRFDMKMIENSLDENSLQYKTEIDGAGVCWGDFWKWCNKKIESVTKISALASTQDKCLGGWFVCGEKQDEEHNIPFSKELFAEKVLKYLWDDAFKRDRSAMFKTECTSLEAMIKLFKDAERFAAFEAIFNLNADDKKALRPNYPEA